VDRAAAWPLANGTPLDTTPTPKQGLPIHLNTTLAPSPNPIDNPIPNQSPQGAPRRAMLTAAFPVAFFLWRDSDAAVSLLIALELAVHMR
jgi:hypothetical protein